MRQPGQRDLRRGRAGGGRDLLDGFQHREAAVGHVDLLDAAGASGLRQVAAPMVLAGEKSAAERGVGDDAQRLLEAEGLELALVLVAEHEVVLRLDRLVAYAGAPIALPQGARESPRVIVRGADVTDLALADQVVEGAQRLLERGVAVVPVRLIE